MEAVVEIVVSICGCVSSRCTWAHVVVSWSVGSNIISRVKKSHVPSMFAVLLVISDGVRVKPAMLPYFLRHCSS
jgi:hypothetical protein